MSTNYRKASPPSFVVSTRTLICGTKCHPSRPGLGAPKAAKHAQLPGRGGSAAGEKRGESRRCEHLAPERPLAAGAGPRTHAPSQPVRRPPATRLPPARRPPVALATVAPRLPEPALVSRLIPAPAPHGPAVFAWAQRRRDNKKWRSGARRRLRQVCGGGGTGEAKRQQGCLEPEETGDWGMSLLLRRRPDMHGAVVTSGSRVKGGA